MKAIKRGRAGFTLIELLVVISLITTLLALTVGIVFRVMENQRETNTNTHLNKIQMMLNQQWKARVDQIKKETVPQTVVDLCRNTDGSIDMDRARAFHLKMRLRQEFPQNFGEVRSGGTVGNYIYAGKPAYLAAIKSPYQPQANTFLEAQPEQQSAALLVLILSQGGGGATTDPEQIAPTKLVDYPQGTVVGTQSGSIQLRVFVDSWNTHIAFRRAADDDMQDVLAELNQPPFVGAGNGDPQDPAGRLKMNFPARAQLASFLASSNPQSRPYIVDPFDGKNRGPFAFSAGKNGLFTNPNGSMEQNLDNLYSFRIQQTNKGN